LITAKSKEFKGENQNKLNLVVCFEAAFGYQTGDKTSSSLAKEN
jgi:hypothetical protein